MHYILLTFFTTFTCITTLAEEGDIPNWLSTFVDTKLMEARRLGKIPGGVISRFKVPLEFLEADAKSTEEKAVYRTLRIDSTEKLESYVRKFARGAAASGDPWAAYKAPNTYEIGAGWIITVDPKLKKITRITMPNKGIEKMPPVADLFFTALLEKDRKKRNESLSKLLQFPIKLREAAYETGGPSGCTTYFRELNVKDLSSLQGTITSIAEALEESDPGEMVGGGYGVAGTADCYHRWGIWLSKDRNTITHVIVDAEDNVYGTHPQKKLFIKEP